MDGGDINGEKPIVPNSDVNVFHSAKILSTKSHEKQNPFAQFQTKQALKEKSKKPRKPFPTKVVILVVLLCTLGIAGYYLYPTIKESMTPDVFDAYGALYADRNKGIKVFDQLIKSAKTADEKEELYTRRARALVESCGSECKDQIYSDARAAESVAESADSAYLLYYVESLFGSEAEAERWKEVSESRGDVEHWWPEGEANSSW